VRSHQRKRQQNQLLNLKSHLIPGALHLNADSYNDATFQVRFLGSMLVDDRLVRAYHQIFLVDRAWAPFEFDLDGVDYDSHTAHGIQRFDFQTCMAHV
jgi:hypothetical protein